MTSPARADQFVSGLPFPLDDFQTQALWAVDEGSSVLVAAPTGSGKTVVAEYACWLALQRGAKCFYTTPLKALSNQKFGDLVAQHGARNVGLLTGDNSINGEAPIVVMTTEVLRNMLYEHSNTLVGLRWVVLDEVHYLQDPYRGAVWEEVLIHLPPEVRVVCLSATVSNVEEFGDWLRALRGDTRVVLERRRPVELRNLVMVGQQLHPLLEDGHKTNPELVTLWARGTAAAARYGRYPPGRPGYRGGNRAPGRPRRRGGSEVYTPTRVEVAEVLDREEMLPAIVFVFSRAGCDEAVEACVRAGIELTSAAERERITEFAHMRAASLDPDDLRALRFGSLLEGLQRGIAAHHAGMLPVFKETIEELFALGFVKLVFATETLSLGINMPARSVVIERLTKFTGEKHELLTPTEYTQLTGRAGRRGIDEIGYGVTLFNPWVSLDKLTSLATVRAYKLTSSFRPSYNMAVNLVRNYDPETATHLLNSSFAQFATDRNVVRWERELEDKERDVADLRAKAACEFGDIVEYARLRRTAERALHDERGSGRVREALVKLGPGDVVWGSFGRAVILEHPRKTSKGATRVAAMTVDRKLRRLGPRDFGEPPEPVARLQVKGQSWRSAKVRGQLARELERVASKRPQQAPKRSEARKLVAAYEAHPCHTCPDVGAHLEFARKLVDASEEVGKLRKQVRRRRGTIARTFERVLAVLQELGYADDWRLTPKGDLLTRVYNEADLLVVECLDRGWLAGLDPEELAAVASLFVYQARGRDEPESAPTPSLGRYERRVHDLYRSLRAVERENDVELLSEPDGGFMAQILEWASGESLEDILEDRETSPGDFVRSTKQVLDLLQQLRQAVDDPELASSLTEAVRLVQRGVVAYSSVL
ncbi:MAG TPA: DEAD/DEAH box helicase [Actinomycetota bacterium]|jgi:ATP-dependent RNA helicase HelY|nr:DEAD/DEAH box helicase [Actinomycetota bacterium]